MTGSQNNPAAILFDSVQSTLMAAAEIGGNRLLDLDPQSLEACRELQGNCVAIEVTDLDFQLYCHPGDWGIRLSREAPAREVDASISGRLMSLVSLATQDDKVSTSIRESVRFNGKVAIAQKLQKILAELDIDWEEALSRHTGDVAAFQIHQQMRNFAGWFRNSADSLLQTTSEYLREEIHLSPTQVEFDSFQAANNRLKTDVARAEARLQRLISKLKSN